MNVLSADDPIMTGSTYKLNEVNVENLETKILIKLYIGDRPVINETIEELEYHCSFYN